MDPILGLVAQFNKDLSPSKLNLAVGAYRDGNGEPHVLPVIHRAEEHLAKLDTTHEYLPQAGLQEFTERSARIIFGDSSSVITEERYATIQTVGGSSALRTGFDFLHETIATCASVYVSQPTWPIHNDIITAAGYSKSSEYRYYNITSRTIDFDGMLADLEQAGRESVIILQACAHNPTGMELSQAEWKKLLEVFKKRQHLPFFDLAYQGLASGDIDEDASAIRLFAEARIDMLVAQSYSKNLGLYGQRVGSLTVVTRSSKPVETIKSHLERIVRETYASPPSYGARIVSTILSDRSLKENWQDDLDNMVCRIRNMRSMLYDCLIKNEAPGNWSHIANQTGMFCYTGLSTEEVTALREEFHIYLTSNGRMNIAGMTEDCVQYVADAMKHVILPLYRQKSETSSW